MIKDNYFTVSRISREDLYEAGFKAVNVSDAEMEEIAEDMSREYMREAFWKHLERAAFNKAIPKLDDCDKEVYRFYLKSLSDKALYENLDDTGDFDFANRVRLYEVAREKGFIYIDSMKRWIHSSDITEEEIEKLQVQTTI